MLHRHVNVMNSVHGVQRFRFLWSFFDFFGNYYDLFYLVVAI